MGWQSDFQEVMQKATEVARVVLDMRMMGSPVYNIFVRDAGHEKGVAVAFNTYVENERSEPEYIDFFPLRYLSLSPEEVKVELINKAHEEALERDSLEMAQLAYNRAILELDRKRLELRRKLNVIGSS